MRKLRPLKIPKRERRDTAARLMPKMRSGEISVERFFAETESDFARLAEALMRRFDLPASVGVEDVAQELRILTMKKIAAWKPEGGVNLSKFVFFAANEKTRTWLNRQREAPRVRGAASRYPLLLLDAVEREERESMLDKVKGSLESPEDEAIAHLDGDAPISAERRFNDMRREFRIRFVVHVHIDEPVRFQIEIGAIRQAKQFLAAEWKIKFKINRAFGIMRQVFRRNLEFVNFFRIDADFIHPFDHCCTKHFKRFFPCFLAYKIFDFHLLEFARTECKIPRCNFVAECFTDLRDTKR